MLFPIENNLASHDPTAGASATSFQTVKNSYERQDEGACARGRSATKGGSLQFLVIFCGFFFEPLTMGAHGAVPFDCPHS